MMLVGIYYQIILIGDSVLLGGLKLRYEVLGVFGLDENVVEYRYDEYSILHGIH